MRIWPQHPHLRGKCGVTVWIVARGSRGRKNIDDEKMRIYIYNLMVEKTFS
jgi:hypothetical protein